MSEGHEQVATLRPRPLSPHLSVYKPQMSSVMSILHRATGAFLALGVLLLGAWLWGAAFDAELFALISTNMSHVVGQVLVLAWAGAFYYHMFNGIRHLGWDMGYGFSVPAMTRSGWLVLLLAAGFTAWLAHYVWMR